MKTESKRRGPRFGERLRGIHASSENPQRDGYYVETIRRTGRLNPGKWYRITDGKGRFWEYPHDGVEFLGQMPPTDQDDWTPPIASPRRIYATIEERFDDNHGLPLEVWPVRGLPHAPEDGMTVVTITETVFCESCGWAVDDTEDGECELCSDAGDPSDPKPTP